MNDEEKHVMEYDIPNSYNVGADVNKYTSY